VSSPSRTRTCTAVALVLLSACGCGDRDVAPGVHRSSTSKSVQSPAAPAAAPAPAAPEATAATATAATAATRSAAERAITRLEDVLRAAAGDSDSPWALAHGLLAFGKDYRARDGRSAVLVAASFAQRRIDEDGRTIRYGFAAAQNGKPVEPHPYLLVKTFIEVGVDPDLEFATADGATIDVRRLITDMRASVLEPQTDAQWHDAAWWLTALELDAAAQPTDLSHWRAAALARLEADDAVLATQAADPFHPSAPMGAAKRGKTHIYGHPCGGLHFFQAVLRAVSASGSAEFRARASRQVRLLLRRHDAERALYAEMLRTHPAAKLLVSGQQLKFFGHLLETLALADELGVLRDDADLQATVTAVRRTVAGDLLATLAALETERAYERLPELAVDKPQLHLDLIGDGCHAIAGLRRTLPTLTR
jgi:hypothetical protein